MSTITERQLHPAMLSLLRARTLVYRRAKRCQALFLVLNLLLPIASAVAAGLMPDARPAIAVLALLLGIFDVTTIDAWMKARLKVGAKMQEQFDCEVLDIDWNEFVAGTRVDAEDTFEDGRRTLNDTDEKRLRDWYPVVVAEVPIAVARVICQRENLVYDSGLRLAYRRLLFWFVVVFVVLLSAASVAFNPSFMSLVLALAPATPALTWALRESKRQSDTLETLTRLKTESERLLKISIKGVDAAEARQRSRELQDAIFGHRVVSSLVFEWLYNLLRPRLEGKLVHGAEHWVGEYRRLNSQELQQ
jgi:SMODS-associating 4TM effector domain